MSLDTTLELDGFLLVHIKSDKDYNCELIKHHVQLNEKQTFELLWYKLPQTYQINQNLGMVTEHPSHSGMCPMVLKNTVFKNANALFDDRFNFQDYTL